MTMPADPMTKMAEAAIQWHQVMSDYEAAGFTHAEAFTLMKSQHREYWSVLYDISMVSADDEA